MVMAAFPVAKLGGLLLKQVSKPIASFAKERAKSHPFFRKYVCMPPAQFYNWCEIKMKMWVLNLGKPVEVPKLNEAMAIELGANLLGETIIFSIAALLVFSEYARSARKEAAKEEAKQKEINDLKNALRDLYFESEKQSAQIRELVRDIYELESLVSKSRPFVNRSKTPPPSGSVPSQSGNSTSDKVTPSTNSVEIVESNKQGLINSALDYVTYVLPNNLHERN
ncbi:putative OPA3-like protein CG13603 [Halyomorpha halys]|uniref:putative OPA3-like protein CG13603 n=1 Tax=Halyomorpha halys TaxID=286706 RepID=UPI0006D51528|nr:putative OPA3-like protein CG13603 [Halyomorpha halys]